jgi:hypothetical protein
MSLPLRRCLYGVAAVRQCSFSSSVKSASLRFAQSTSTPEFVRRLCAFRGLFVSRVRYPRLPLCMDQYLARLEHWNGEQRLAIGTRITSSESIMVTMSCFLQTPKNGQKRFITVRGLLIQHLVPEFFQFSILNQAKLSTQFFSVPSNCNSSRACSAPISELSSLQRP